MKSATVFGVVTRLGNPVAIRSAAGRTLDAYAVDDYDLELEGADIDLDHDPEAVVGTLVYAEINDQNLAVVGVVDGVLAEIEQPVYFSGSYARHGDHGLRERSAVVPQAKVLGMSLTLSPANSSAQAVDWMPGDVRDSVSRGSWPLSWSYSHPLLERAVDSLGSDWRARTRSASRIVDRRRAEIVELAPGVFIDGDGELIPTSTRRADAGWTSDGRPSGKMRYGPPGKVLRVS